MRPPQKPPEKLSLAYLEQNAGHIFSILVREDVRTYLTNVNREYYHWDELRRRPLPAGLSREDAWIAVKLSRTLNKSLPLSDVRGAPFRYWLSDHVQQTLHMVDRDGGSVLAADPGEPNVLGEMRDRVLIDSLMEEAIATSQIEGAVTTRKIAKEMLRTGRRPRNKSEQMILNGYNTIRLLRQRLDRPMSVDLLHEIQASMTRDTLDHPDDAGRFRTAADPIAIVDMRDGDVVFTPPPAEMLPARLAAMMDFANADPSAEPFVHPLVRAVILHFWLAYEHPYVDGNGRTARALFYWSMLRSGYWLFEFLTISRIIHASSMTYYRSFQYTESDDNDLTYFLASQIEFTRRALADLHKRLGEMRAQQRRMQAFRLTASLNSRQRALVDHALRHPDEVYTIASHQHSHGISDETARHDLVNLVAHGLLAEIGGRRPRQFTAAPELPRRLQGD